MRPFFERALPLTLAANLLLFAPAAYAQTAAGSDGAAASTEADKARVLYNEALDMRDAGDHKGALQLFLAAYSHVRSPVIGVDLAHEQLQLGHVVDALAVVEEIGRMPVTADETEKSGLARAEAARLASDLPKRVGTLRVTTGRPLHAGERILVDGVDVPEGELAKGRRIDPGKHTILVRAAPDLQRDVVLAEGESSDLVIPLDDPRPPAPPIAPATATRTTSPLTYLGFGIAGAGLVVGGITGLAAFSKTASLDHACASNGNCPPDRDADIRSARTMGSVSTLAFAVGGTGLVVGIMGLLGVGSKQVAPATSGKITPWIGVGSAGVVGAF